MNLSKREKQMCECIANGKKHSEIAELLGLQKQSVKNIMHSVYKKLNCHNQTQAVVKAYSRGLIDV